MSDALQNVLNSMPFPNRLALSIETIPKRRSPKPIMTRFPARDAREVERKISLRTATSTEDTPVRRIRTEGRFAHHN